MYLIDSIRKKTRNVSNAEKNIFTFIDIFINFETLRKSYSSSDRKNLLLHHAKV